MLKRINQLEKQHGGAIPFSALKDKKSKTKKKSKKRSKKMKRKKKRTISPARAHRKAAKKSKRSKKKTVREKKEKNCGCGSHVYTGKELSPQGIGICSECTTLHIVRKGKDGKLYENTNNGWVKIN